MNSLMNWKKHTPQILNCPNAIHRSGGFKSWNWSLKRKDLVEIKTLLTSKFVANDSVRCDDNWKVDDDVDAWESWIFNANWASSQHESIVDSSSHPQDNSWKGLNVNELNSPWQ